MTEPKRRIIALGGWRGSGKDTIANHLTSMHQFKQVSFAAKLKDMVADMYKVPREYLDSPTLKEMPLSNLPVIPSDPFTETLHLLLKDELKHGFWTPRALCILEGSVKRSVTANYWVRTVIEDILNQPAQSFVISDMRYKSEADTLNMFFDNELQLWRVQRYESITTTDPSERNLDDFKFDAYLHNTKDIQSLCNTIDALVLGKPS